MTMRWWAILGIELLVGLVMLAGYQAWVQPGAPRNQSVSAPAATPLETAAAAVTEPARPQSMPTHTPAPVAREPRPAALPKPAVAKAPRKSGSPADLVAQGQAALNARDYAGALKLLNQAQAAAPANPDLGYLRGLALENLGQPGAAIDAYRSCTSGPYTQIAANHVKMLASKLRQ
jgi:predicted Zn-dependent protease